VRKKPKLDGEEGAANSPATPTNQSYSSSTGPSPHYSPLPGQPQPLSQPFHTRFDSRQEQGFAWQHQTPNTAGSDTTSVSRQTEQTNVSIPRFILSQVFFAQVAFPLTSNRSPLRMMIKRTDNVRNQPSVLLASKENEQQFTKALHQPICKIHQMLLRYWRKLQTVPMMGNLLEASKLLDRPRTRERKHHGKIYLTKWMITGITGRFWMA